ncbi:DUF1826 domain-containing protein [Microbulbifer sp. A4B17]|uniref:DUF1826 domain-containing protein n=1 Tax=Microbulbifer sp. A4B17 TaxID=359370 RepID=UPI000D52B46A|nr:DUF1826 domain-containing protein [Microbulbifer sp. A4B17]AWF81213.1 DUF1826 domain-containing protein [Microbulbifer sp. A4B17]
MSLTFSTGRIHEPLIAQVNNAELVPFEKGVPEVKEPDTRRAVSADTGEVLADIFQTDINMAIWQRELPSDIASDCQSLFNNGVHPNRRILLPTTKIDSLAEVLPELKPYPHLCADIQLLADMFSYLFELNGVGIRLTTLNGAMCPKFHVDRVPCRLITTYLGTGTEWLTPDSIDPNTLDLKANQEFPSTSINHLACGSVALLKGELWEGNEGFGLIHRSPSVEPGQLRLLLTFDFGSTDE